MFSTPETIALCLAFVVIGFDQGWRWQRRRNHHKISIGLQCPDCSRKQMP